MKYRCDKYKILEANYKMSNNRLLFVNFTLIMPLFMITHRYNRNPSMDWAVGICQVAMVIGTSRLSVEFDYYVEFNYYVCQGFHHTSFMHILKINKFYNI